MKRIQALRLRHPDVVPSDFTGHDVRRLAARDVAKKGSTKDAQKKLRHNNSRTTNMYMPDDPHPELVRVFDSMTNE